MCPVEVVVGVRARHLVRLELGVQLCVRVVALRSGHLTVHGQSRVRSSPPSPLEEEQIVERVDVVRVVAVASRGFRFPRLVEERPSLKTVEVP